MLRRDWLALMAATSAFAAVPRAARANQKRAGSVLRYGLFVDEDQLPAIRQNYAENPLFAELRHSHDTFDYAEATRWIETELRTNDQLFDIRKLGGLIEEAAFIYLFREAPEALALVRTGMLRLMDFQRWDFFLDGDIPIAVQRAAQLSVVTAIVMDFMGSAFSSDERAAFMDALWERGCKACYRSVENIRHPEQVIDWRFDPESTYFEHRPDNRTDMNRRAEITFNTNLRAAPASGLLVGNLVIERELGRTRETERYHDMGMWGISDFKSFYKSDGSYDEEVNYANFTAFHIIQAVLALDRMGRADAMDVIDWEAYADYHIQMAMPTHENPYAIVNWGDSGAPPTTPGKDKRVSLPAWIARTYRNGSAQALVEQYAGSQTVWSALWHDPRVRPSVPAEVPTLWVSQLDRVVARTGYGVNDLVVAMRSGPPANHEHADRNSLIVKCFGEELIADPLRPPYSFADPGWNLRLTEGHSAVLINGQGHQHHNGVEGTNASNAYARVLSHHQDDQVAHWVSDASQAYRLVDVDIRRVLRSVSVLFDVPGVVVVDRLTMWDREATLTARFYGYNLDAALRMTPTADGFRIDRPHATLRATTWCNVDVAAVTGQIELPAELAEKHRCIDVHCAPAKEVVLVSVLSLAPRGAASPAATISAPGDLSEPIRVTVGARSLTLDPRTLALG